ncbi:Lamin Tail Domain [Arenibacter nanhaiticus]|uniref:Lamin Tail Domain n=1 Tax=Arenibacter nanhaiticus TaxID=558155 RepID=A0A1M6D6A3_9FLAO|nr:DUF5689 domain-containing protein [Arenibacter nanhaiticus]SHI68739.1 Lamin Tail Domain [Arenibacter nanhaiticus]
MKRRNIIPFRMLLFLFGLCVLWACVKDSNFKTPQKACEAVLQANTSFDELKAMYTDGVIQIQDDLVIEGFVNSSDLASNFFGTLHFQDTAEDPSSGMQIEIDLRDSHLFYAEGGKILIRLKGLYLGSSKGVLKLGGVFSSFGNLSVGRLPAAIVAQHVLTSCDESGGIVPKEVTMGQLSDTHVNTLVTIKDVQIISEELGLTFADKEEETLRTLTHCDGDKLSLKNSGYANFQANLLPEGRGSIVGVLLKEHKEFLLVIRNADDIDFIEKRCEKIPDEFTSNLVFISELADPNNNTEARFVELYNAGSEPLSLKGWKLLRYTNANSEISATINLTDYSIGAKSTFLISPNAAEFLTVYGFSPDFSGAANGPADSNGDDNLELVDPFGTVIDRFGVVGEDGSGTNHEFEDGRALRNENINSGNTLFTFSEWTIYNDTGAAGTINLPQNAPADFSPGIR